MVVILLLSSTYSTINGCDGGSNDSNTSTTSTGETAIPTTANLKANYEFNTTTTNTNTATTINSNSPNTANSTKNLPQTDAYKNAAIYPDSSQNYYADTSPATDYSWRCYISTSPPPPMGAFYQHYVDDYTPPQNLYWQQQQQQHQHQYAPFNSFSPQISTIHHHPNQPQFNNNNEKTKSNKQFTNKFSTNSSDIVRHVTRVNFYDIDTFQVEFEPKDDDNICDTEAITKDEEWITKRKTELTTTRQIETRVKRQVVLEDGKVVEDSGPIVSTNTTEDTDKQETETTEKRDLGIPTDIKNLESVDAIDGVNNKDQALTSLADQELAVLNGGDGKIIKKMVPRPADGLVRESNDKRVITHEEIKDYLETEDVKHYGDFSDETYVKAVNSGAENLDAVLLSPESKKQLVPLGPRTVANTTKSFKTIDSEDVQKRSLAQEDGTIITEKKKTTEHEIILDKDLPEKDDHSTGCREQIKTAEATQRYYKQRDEQNVDLVADGKVVGTEMRYAAETMQVEKDGSLERPGDWDSLSDRMRKMRRQQHKSLVQQQKAALLADRKDALTKRPLDFDREEETRKGETMKWLESHFGSESTASNDSRDEDAAIEPTKKTYFNVTIKSNEAQQATTTKTYERKQWEERKPHSPPLNVAAPTTTAPIPSKTKYYQGISNWNDRKETPHFASKAFRDDLKETIERNRLRRGNGTVHASREKLNENNRYIAEPQDTYVSREDILHQKRQSLSSQFLARNKRTSRENLNDIESSTLGRNLGGSRNDLRYNNKPLQEDNHRRPYINGGNVTANGSSTMKRSDYIENRAKSYERTSNDSTHAIRYDEMPNSNLRPFTHNDEPKKTQTLGRPTVPQRRRAIERKIRQQSSESPTIQTIVPSGLQRNGKRISPARSRSSTPPNDYDLNDTPHVDYIPSSTSTLTKKQTQRTRFAPTTTTHTTQRHQTVQTQTTPPSNLSTSTATSHKSSKVGQVIGNSLRKLVNKIRSVSAERKMRMKSKSKSREQSPSFQQDTLDRPVNGHAGHTTTYQQYNVIDSHIGGQPASNESEQESIRQTPTHGGQRRDTISHERPMTNGVGQTHHQQQLYKRATSADPYTNENDVHSPRQRYYLGEDPYSSTLYGQENLYDPMNRKNNVQYVRNRESLTSNQNRKNNQQYGTLKYGEGDSTRQRTTTTTTTTHTLGRYPRGRITESTPNLHQDYRTIQTLPRKLNDSSTGQNQQYGYQKMTQRSATTLNGGYHHHTLGHPERRSSTTQNMTTTTTTAHQLGGPAKPARTYAKALNRSKSFNVHGLNGSNDPSPIYIEKLTKNNYNNSYNSSNNYNNSNLKQSQAYKSNPMLHSGLKSPSIVNLISRSQKDLTKIGTKDDTDSDLYVEQRSNYAPPTNYVAMHGNTGNRSSSEKKQIFLKELHERAPDLYRTLEGNDYVSTKTSTKYPLHAQRSLDARSPIEINKDTASIYRRGSLSNEEYVPVPSYNRKGYGSTIVEVRK